MKNIKWYQILIVNLILFVIIFLNYKSFTEDKKYIFERTFEEISIIKLDKKIQIPIDSSFSPIFPSSIPNIAIKHKTDIEVFLYNINGEKKDSFSINLLQNLFPLYISKNTIYSSDQNGILYINNNRSAFHNLKAMAFKKNNSSFCVLGESQEKDGFYFGFYNINQDFKKKHLISLIEKNKTSKFSELSLKYNGYFTNSSDKNNLFGYITNKTSNIWIFNDDSLYSTFQTLDKTPTPTILKRNDMFMYKRGDTYNTNMSAFIYSNSLYVFSVRNSEKYMTLIDCYSLNGNYQQSYKIPNLGQDPQTISQVFMNGKSLLIGYNDKYFLSFKVL